jgi:Mandelate racemase / muconate lactonizing enzyme, N-terminal domain
MLTRRNLFTMAAAAPLSGTLNRSLAVAAEAKKQIKIIGIETDLLRVPAEPYSDAIHDFGGDGGGVVLRLKTDAGITGWGYSNFGMIAGGPRVVQTILEHEIKPVLVGRDPAFPKRIRADLWRALEYQGVQGVTQFAMSVVDIAVWDILGKAAGLPVYKMLGAVRDRMPAYAMCGWYRENDKDHSQYKRTIDETLEIGYRAFKVKVGRGDLDDDVERIEVGFQTARKRRAHHGGRQSGFQPRGGVAPRTSLSAIGLLLVRRADRALRPRRLCGIGGGSGHPHCVRRERVQQARIHGPITEEGRRRSAAG